MSLELCQKLLYSSDKEVRYAKIDGKDTGACGWSA